MNPTRCDGTVWLKRRSRPRLSICILAQSIIISQSRLCAAGSRTRLLCMMLVCQTACCAVLRCVSFAAGWTDQHERGGCQQHSGCKCARGHQPGVTQNSTHTCLPVHTHSLPRASQHSMTAGHRPAPTKLCCRHTFYSLPAEASGLALASTHILQDGGQATSPPHSGFNWLVQLG
jgi:hypothetical protein